MKKKTLFFILSGLFILIFNSGIQAQVTISFIQPPPNQWKMEYMWNASINNSGKDITIYLTGTLEEKTRGLIAHAETGKFTAKRGSFPLRVNDLKPTTHYDNGKYEEIVRKTGTLPDGTYIICVTVFSSDGQELSKDCFEQTMAITSPPELTYPGNESTLQETQPVFQWMPPMPATPGEITTYKLKIVELLDGQVPIEAMEANPAFFTKESIRSASFQFPLSARPFVAGKNYAWQVAAHGKNYEIGKSQVWMFIYGNNYQIRVDSLIFRHRPDPDTKYPVKYDFALYVTNINPGNANLSITRITKTTPKSDSPIIIPDKTPVTIKSGAQGIMTGTINTGKTDVKNIDIEIKLEDQFKPSLFFVTILVNGVQGTGRPKYDFGDATDPTFPSLSGHDGAKHEWPAWEGRPNIQAWLGKAPDNYNGINPVCVPCIPPLPKKIDFETNANHVDAYDDGVHFFDPPSNYCTACEIDSIDVTFNIDQYYTKENPLLFHAWFDFTRDGDWDDCGTCLVQDTSIRKGNISASIEICEHVRWLYSKRLCPNPTGNKVIEDKQSFEIVPFSWGTNNYCATYRLYFYSGFNNPDYAPTRDTMWARFRLTPKVDDPTSTNPSLPYMNAGNYKYSVTGGEVEDWPIVCNAPAPVADFGDAPDELDNPALHYCTHLLLDGPYNCYVEDRDRYARWSGSLPIPWSTFQAASHGSFAKEWLGDINYSPCSDFSKSADLECNGRTINLDIPYDNGVKFSGLFHYPFLACDTQRVQVMINTDDPTIYNGNAPLHLHAWFDWEQNGQWDNDNYLCNQDHVKWLTARPVSPAGAIFPVGSEDFVINPQLSARWPDPNSHCQIYELTFLSGQPASGGKVTDTLWCRFRLYWGPEGVNAKYYRGVKRGEVEDYPIVPDVTQSKCERFQDSRDLKFYNAVQIGTQCWMAQNLDVGTQIPSVAVSHSIQSDNNVIEKFCYEDNPANCVTYGGLYEWAEALNYNGATNDHSWTLPSGNIQGICPTGWHIPSDNEWIELETFLGMPLAVATLYGARGTIGGHLKATGTLLAGTGLWANPNAGADNSSGFWALPNGVRDNYTPIHNFHEQGDDEHFWTTRENNAGFAFLRHLKCGTDEVGRDPYPKWYSISVRCLRD
jgi:uncharacterized protein (TIGR02145 family)